MRWQRARSMAPCTAARFAWVRAEPPTLRACSELHGPVPTHERRAFRTNLTDRNGHRVLLDAEMCELLPIFAESVMTEPFPGRHADVRDPTDHARRDPGAAPEGRADG